jgi:DNA primase
VHGDRTPSVSISEERGLFRCWVCDDVRGDVISLVQLCNGCSFLEALNWLKDTYPFLVPGKGNRPISESRAAALEDKLVEKLVEPKPAKELIPEDERKKVILAFLKMLSPVDGTPAAAYLARRRIFKPIWDKMLLRTITDYDGLNRRLKETYSMEVLQYVGLFNDKGNLRYYKHPLIFPYLDSQMRASHFQARALERSTEPKELHLRGTVPFPYNVSALNQKMGWIYLCEGVVDTLTMLQQNIDAVGIPGVRSFKADWVPLFKNKNVVLCLDHDEAGRKGMEYLQGVFGNAGIRTIILGDGLENLPAGMKDGQDVNEWFGGRK